MYSEAESSCLQALDVLDNPASRDYPFLIATLNIYVHLLLKTGRKAQAEPLETRAMVYSARFKEINNTR